MERRPRKLIVSASRRQDLPACAPGALLAQLAARELCWRHPFTQKPSTLRFEPEEVFCLALWSKDFGRLLADEARAVLDPLRPYFLFTVNDCPELEPGLGSSLEARLGQVERIVRRYGAGRLLWRYDPLVHWLDTSGRERSNVAGFVPIARRMAALGVTRVAYSFAQIYGKVRRREQGARIRFVDPPLERKREILGALADEAAALGIQMLGCCQPELEGVHPNAVRARCIDGPYLCSVIDADPTGLDLGAHPSRPGCGCTRSVDVGSYAPCAHGCVYCYANAAAGASSTRPAPHPR